MSSKPFLGKQPSSSSPPRRPETKKTEKPPLRSSSSSSPEQPQSTFESLSAYFESLSTPKSSSSKEPLLATKSSQTKEPLKSSFKPPFPPILPPLPVTATESETTLLSYSEDSKNITVRSNTLVPSIHLSQIGKKTNDITVSAKQDIVSLAVNDYLGVSKHCLNYCVSVHDSVKDFNSKLGDDGIKGSGFVRESIRGFRFPSSYSLVKIETEQVLNRSSDKYKRKTCLLKWCKLGKMICDTICFIYLAISSIFSMLDAVYSPQSIIETIFKALPIPAFFGSISLILDGIITDTQAKIWVLSAVKTTVLSLLLDVKRCEASQDKAVGIIEAVDLELFETLVEEYMRFYADGWFRFTYNYPQKEHDEAKAYILSKAEDVVKKYALF